MTSVQKAICSARERFGISQALPENLPSSVTELLAHAVSQSADLPAFSCLGSTLSYRQVSELSDHFAAFLQHETDLEPGDRIAIQLPNLLQYPVVAFGALKAGLVLVNTNPLYTRRELQAQLKDSGARAIVALDSLIHNCLEVLSETDVELVVSTGAADLSGTFRRILLQTAIKASGKGRKVAVHKSEVALRMALQVGKGRPVKPVSPSPQDIALLQYTGGTTGIAKGAELTHANLTANTMQTLAMLGPSGIQQGREIIIAPLPLYHIFSFVVSMVMMIHVHGHIHLIPDPRNVPALVKVLRKSRFTVFFGLNTLFSALMRDRRFADVDFSTLKLTASGGMALTETVAGDWKKVTGCPITEGYGLTETSPVLAVNIPGEELIGTVGVAVPSTEVRIVDEQGVEQPTGGSGELWAKGPQVMRGYWNHEQDTDSVDSEGWFRTGDIAGVEADGRIRILDRKKDMIIVSGFNVYPNEIENLFNSHPDVLESAAIGIPDELTGEAVKLFVVALNKQLDADRLKQWCREQLTAYKVPRHIEFRDDLPKSNVGKVLRARLRR